MYILPGFDGYFWASAHFCENVHTNFEEIIPFLYVHFGFVCTFCGHFAHFLPKFSPKSGQNLYTQKGFCTHKIEEKSVNLMDFGLIFGIFDCFVCTNGVCVYILWPKTHFFFLFNHDKKFIYFI